MFNMSTMMLLRVTFVRQSFKQVYTLSSYFYSYACVFGDEVEKSFHFFVHEKWEGEEERL